MVLRLGRTHEERQSAPSGPVSCRSRPALASDSLETASPLLRPSSILLRLLPSASGEYLERSEPVSPCRGIGHMLGSARSDRILDHPLVRWSARRWSPIPS